MSTALKLENPIKQVREALGISQEEMARRLGISINTERRCEYDRREPKNAAVRDRFKQLLEEAAPILEAQAGQAA